MSVLDRAAVRLLPAVPRPVVRRLSARHIAGPALDDACRAVAALNAAGRLATIDEYSLRRLQENPRMAGYVAADVLGRLLRRRPV